MSVGQVFALVAGFLALAVIGATLGWTLTDTSGGTPQTTPTLPASVPATSSSTATPTPSVTPSTSTTAPTGQVVPNFAKQGTSFIDARKQLAADKIQGVPVFLGGNGNNTVVRTSPAAGQPISKGDTVKLYVNESPPLLAVPDETNKPCKSAGSDLAATGFRPDYPSGHNGVVLSQNPDSASQTARWNDTVHLTCGTPQVSPSPSQSSAPSSTGPSSGTGN